MRALTPDELWILESIQELYGSQNTLDDVFINDADEAVIFVKEPDGSLPIMIVLTNTAATARAQGLSAEDVFRELVPAGLDPVSYRKVLELKTLPEGIRVSHRPNPAYARPAGQSGYRYTWSYATAVEALHGPVVVEEFGAFFHEDGEWVLSTVTGEPFTRADFEHWYSCPGGVLRAGSACSDLSNWTGSDELISRESLWYFIALDSEGSRVAGAAVIELIGELRVSPVTGRLE